MDERVLAGTQAQLENWRAELAAGAERVGWKIGLNTPEAQQRAGISAPVVGYMTSNTLLRYGARVSLAGMTNPMLEPEVAVQIGPTGDPGDLGAAIELVDMDEPIDDIERVVARNIFHRGVMFGGPRPGMSPPPEVALLVNGEERDRAPVEFDEWTPVNVVADTLAAAGELLVPGDTIIAGSLTAPLAVKPGDAVGMQLGPLGFLQVVFLP